MRIFKSIFKIIFTLIFILSLTACKTAPTATDTVSDETSNPAEVAEIPEESVEKVTPQILIPDYEGYEGEPPSEWAVGGYDMFKPLFSKDDGLSNITKNFKRPITRLEFAKLTRLFLEYQFRITLETPAVSEFTDTSDTDALKVYNAGFIKGRGRRVFAPDELITRQEAAGCVVNATFAIEDYAPVAARLTEPIPTLPTKDAGEVSANYGIEVRTAYANGFMTGVSEDMWMPNGTLTIEQALRLFNNVYDFYSNNGE
ncbi:hypothetical protein FACS1894188_01340 [Clostridia bacterium]|nr:hypothetical protein FACS1894188_01340 [Clostridia bacterium]